MTTRRSTTSRVMVGAAAVAILVLTVAGPASSTTNAILTIDSVDARDGHLNVDVTFVGAGDPGAAVVKVGGQSVPTSSKKLSDVEASDAMIVLDSSATVGNGAVQLAKDQLSHLDAGSSSIRSAGLVTTGGGVKVRSRLSSSAGGVVSGSTEVFSEGVNIFWDAAAKAVALLAEVPGQRNLILVVGSADGGSEAASAADVIAAAHSASVAVHVIAITGHTLDADDLRLLVATTGGSIQSGTDGELAGMVAGTAKRIDSQYRLTATGNVAAKGELNSLSVSLGAATASASFRPGQVTSGAGNLRYVAKDAADGGIFSKTWMKYLVVGLASFAIAALAFAVGHLAVKRKDGLDFTLRHYDESFAENSVHVGDATMARTAFLQRAVAVAGGFAEKRGFLVRVEELLERADLPLRAAEALFFYVALAMGAVVIAWVVSGSPLAALATAIVAGIAPGFTVDFLARRRKKKFVQLLPDMLSLLAGTLRAGYSVGQGIEAVSMEVSEPMGKELRRAVTEARLGRPLDEALAGVATRMGSDDFEWAVLAIRIQREVGGNLAELLMTVAETMTQRERLRRDVAALTAEGKMSAIVIGLLPPALAAAMYAINPNYIIKLFSGTGLYMLVGAGVMMIIGFIWMKKCIEIEV